MTTHTTAGAPGRPAQPDLALSLLIAAAAVLEALALLLRPLLAHAIALMLTIAGWRPARSAAPAQKPAVERTKARPASAPAPMPAPSPAPAQWPAAALTDLPVRELRQLARQAGHRALARKGRRADLLLALAA